MPNKNVSRYFQMLSGGGKTIPSWERSVWKEHFLNHLWWRTRYFYFQPFADLSFWFIFCSVRQSTHSYTWIMWPCQIALRVSRCSLSICVFPSVLFSLWTNTDPMSDISQYIDLELCYSKYSLWTWSTDIAEEPVRNVESQDPPYMYWIRTCILTRFLCDL